MRAGWDEYTFTDSIYQPDERVARYSCPSLGWCLDRDLELCHWSCKKLPKLYQYVKARDAVQGH